MSDTQQDSGPSDMRRILEEDYRRRDNMLRIAMILVVIWTFAAFLVDYPLWVVGLCMFPGGVVAGFLMNPLVTAIVGPSVPGGYWSYAPMTPRKFIDILVSSFYIAGIVVLSLAGAIALWGAFT